MSRKAKLKKAREKMLRKYPREAAKWWRSKIEEAIHNANPPKEEEERKPSQSWSDVFKIPKERLLKIIDKWAKG